METNGTRRVVNRHFTEGGTAVTNFDDDERALYEAAVREYGDPDLVITESPMPPQGRGCALHYLNGSRPELGCFWEVFYELRQRQNAR